MPHQSLKPLTCKKDGGPLYLFADVDGKRVLVCLNCGASGPYEEMANQGAGLVAGVYSQEQCGELRRKVGLVADRSPGGPLGP